MISVIKGGREGRELSESAPHPPPVTGIYMPPVSCGIIPLRVVCPIIRVLIARRPPPPPLPATQDVILNVSLTAVTMLWNVSDQLTRNKAALMTPTPPGAVVAADGAVVGASPASYGAASGGGLAQLAAAGWLGSGTAAGGTVGGGTMTTAGRRDVSEADGLEMLRIAFRALHAASNDVRPEVGGRWRGGGRRLRPHLGGGEVLPSWGVGPQ